MQTGQSVPVTAEGDFIDLSEYCRLCLQLPEESQLLDLNLIYDEEEQLSYYDCFTICTQIELLADDELPHNLCKSCGLELQIAYDFRKKVEQSKKLLSQMECKELEAMNVTEEPEEAPKPSTTFAITNDDIELDIHTTDEMPATVEVTTTEEVPVVEEMAIEQLDVTEVDELEEHLDLDEYQCVEELVDEEPFDYFLVEELPYTTDAPVPLPYNGSCEFTPTTLSPDNFLYATSDSAATTCTDTPPIIFTPDENSVEFSGNSNDMPLKLKRSRNVRCDFCHKTFKTRCKMLYHRRMHDVNRKQYACPHPGCNSKYLSKQSCDIHYRHVHSTPDQFTPLECTLCHKTFAIPQTLEVHMRYHTREFPYECKHCGRKYAQKGHLTTHLQVKHNNLRYICPELGCSKIFKNSISLRNHSFVHTGMPFRCSYCDKGYPQKSKLKVHLSMKHNVQMSIEELESMRKYKGKRTRHSFVRLETASTEHVERENECLTAKVLQYDDIGEEIEVAL